MVELSLITIMGKYKKQQIIEMVDLVEMPLNMIEEGT